MVLRGGWPQTSLVVEFDYIERDATKKPSGRKCVKLKGC